MYKNLHIVQQMATTSLHLYPSFNVFKGSEAHDQDGLPSDVKPTYVITMIILE